MLGIVRRSLSRLQNRRGFTLVELLVVIAVVGILVAIAVQRFESMSAKSRITRAQNDAKAIGTAVGVFAAHMGTLPGALNELTLPAINTAGIPAGPFLQVVPNPPGAAWTPFTYTPQPNGTFTISTTGDGVVVNWP
jgi:type IV pilus assembly protein PilA